MKLPLDIWLLTLQDMATEGDLEGLFHVAQTSRTLAHFALQLLYEHLPSTGSGDGASVIIRSMWWRSVIMSILGQTSQPYYAFVKVLSLFSLYCHLLDFNSTTQVRLSGCTGPELRDAFFSYPLQAVKIQDGKGRLDAGAVVVQVANLLSKRLQATGAAHDDATTLSVLERTNLPTGNWPEWASRPARLTSLSVRPIDSLSGDLARAIRKACPRFKELEWRDSSEFSSDKTAGEFIQNLAPNSLVSFQVFWNISVGPEIIQALGSQIMSLRHLGLPRLQNPALEALPLVGPLVGLKSFKLGFGWELPSMVPAGDIRQTIISWMKQQVSLKEFELEYYEETIEFVQELLGGLEKTKLESLTICQDYGSIASLSSQDQIRLYDEVGKQTALRSLCLSDDYEVLEEEDYPAVLDETQPQQLALANALALLTELRSLKISSPMSYRAFVEVTRSCPYIEDLSFLPYGPEDGREDGREHSSVWLKDMKRLRNLKKLEWESDSFLRPKTLVDFFADLADDPLGCHHGFNMTLRNQAYSYDFTKKKGAIAHMLRQCLGGKFAVTYGQNYLARSYSDDLSDDEEDDDDDDPRPLAWLSQVLAARQRTRSTDPDSGS